MIVTFYLPIAQVLERVCLTKVLEEITLVNNVRHALSNTRTIYI